MPRIYRIPEDSPQRSPRSGTQCQAGDRPRELLDAPHPFPAVVRCLTRSFGGPAAQDHPFTNLGQPVGSPGRSAPVLYF